MVVLEALGLSAMELFDYNRMNYKFDQEQRLERDLQKVEMQIKRFDLFRQDINDLVQLTVGKMDMYHLVGALFLGFTCTMYTEGKIHGPQPQFFNGMYYLHICGAFVYLLLAVWLSMHASISSHSYGVRLRTRYVRLPIPSLSIITDLTSRLSDFEKQGLSKMFRIPFGPGTKQEWKSRTEVEDRAGQQGPAGAAGAGTGAAGSVPARSVVGGLADQAFRGVASSSAAPPSSSQMPEEGHAAMHRMASAELLGSGDAGFGQEDAIFRAAAVDPGRHVSLFRKLAAKWQCYDAYSRVCMALGVNQIIKSINFFLIGMCLLERNCPSTAYAATIILHAAAIGIAYIDIAGLHRWQIFAIQLVGLVPVVIVLVMFTLANRDRGASGRPMNQFDPSFLAAPVAFFVEAIWYQLLLWTAHPSNDEATLPRRFRSVLFLDVFGDANYDPTEAEHAKTGPAGDARAAQLHEAHEMNAAAAEQALATAHAALRRWEGAPQELLTEEQSARLTQLRTDYMFWRQLLQADLTQHKRHRGVPYDAAVHDPVELRPWAELSPAEQHEDEFACTLLGPLKKRHPHGKGMVDYHYDLDGSRHVLGEVRAGQFVLTLDKASHYVDIVIRRVRNVLAEPEDGLRGSRDGSTDGGARAGDDSDSEDGDIVRSGSDLGGSRSKRSARVQRLPWKIMARLTNVLQLSWLFLGVQLALQDAGYWSVDFMYDRRLSATTAREAPPSPPLGFESVEVEWPHGAFFRPEALGYVAGPSGAAAEVFVGSPFASYKALPSAAARRLEPLPRDVFPSGAVPLCRPNLPLSTREPCLMGALAPGGLALWSSNATRRDATLLPVEQGEWRLLAGAVVPCSDVAMLAAQPVADIPWCLAVAGWDGTGLPVAVVPLSRGPAAPPAASDGASVAPRVDILMDPPLQQGRPPRAPRGVHAAAGHRRARRGDVLQGEHLGEGAGAKRGAAGSCRPTEAQDLLALHLEPGSRRLWALAAGGGLQAWSLPDLQGLGRWRPVWPALSHTLGAATFQAAALCEESATGHLLVAGLSRSAAGETAPGLVRAPLPPALAAIVRN